MAGSLVTQTLTVTVAGKTLTHTRNKTVKQLKTISPSLAAAKIGQLTTRTSNTVGTLTMNSGHGFLTGQRLDIYWVENNIPGHRRGVTIGTVSGDTVPFSGGDGDNLPTNNTAVTAQVPEENEFVVTGDNVKSISILMPRKGIVVFASSGNAEQHFRHHPEAGTNYHWDYLNGDTNPLAGDAVAKVFISNGDSAGTSDTEVAVGHD